jgi:dihydroneopterin aldolase
VSDRIRIQGLRVDAHVGVTAEERARVQTLELDIDIDADLSKASESDELADTVDYSQTVSRVAEVVGSTECKLLEHLASKVVSVVSCMEGVLGVAVEVSKRPPPLNESAEAVTVRIERPSV